MIRDIFNWWVSYVREIVIGQVTGVAFGIVSETVFKSAASYSSTLPYMETTTTLLVALNIFFDICGIVSAITLPISLFASIEKHSRTGQWF
jgi:hypothetical protein